MSFDPWRHTHPGVIPQQQQETVDVHGLAEERQIQVLPCWKREPDASFPPPLIPANFAAEETAAADGVVVVNVVEWPD